VSVSIIDRLTQAIRIADQSMHGTASQADYRNWHEVHRTLQDARDELSKPKTAWQQLAELNDAALAAPKIDGRSKEARALRAAALNQEERQ